MTGGSVTCRKCTKYLQKREKQRLQKVKPVHPFAPLSQVNKVRLGETVKHLTSENKELNKELKLRVQREVSENSIEINLELVGDIENIMSKNTENITPFMQLIRQQEKESSITKGYGNRYHPMIIKFCLCLASKSASTYDELRSSNVLTLPSRRTLSDYKNAIKPHAGFNTYVIAKDLEGSQRNVVLSFDEMKIEENLVYGKYSGELVGYVDLGDPDLNYASFENSEVLASHVMVFFIRSLGLYIASANDFLFQEL